MFRCAREHVQCDLHRASLTRIRLYLLLLHRFACNTYPLNVSDIVSTVITYILQYLCLRSEYEGDLKYDPEHFVVGMMTKMTVHFCWRHKAIRRPQQAAKAFYSGRHVRSLENP